MTQSTHIAIYALTRQGVELAKRLNHKMGGTVYSTHQLADDWMESFDSLPELVGETFSKYDGHIFVAAAGIAVRCIAPHLKSKDVDPAVICLDQEGHYVVSLLSGHLGGANELAIKCARAVGAQPVITTATDSAGVPSMDMLAAAKGLVIGNIDRIKVVNGALLDSRTVQVFDPDNHLDVRRDGNFTVVDSSEAWKVGEPGVWVSWEENCPDDQALKLYPRVLHLGIGCRRDIPKDEIVDHVTTVFKKRGLALKSISSIGSVEAKRDEAGLLEAARIFGVEPVFYTTKELGAVKTPTPSNKVQIHMGVPSVAEASAMLTADNGELILAKEKTQTVTLAVARRTDA